MPDGRKCWAGSEALQAVDSWRNAGAAECRHRRLERSSSTSTSVHSRSDTGELPLPAWKVSGRGRRASEVRRVVSDPGRGQTSRCRWRHAQQRSTYAVTCPLLSLVHQQEQCCSNQSVNSQRSRQVYPTSLSPTTAEDVGLDKVGSSSPRRCERRGDPDSDQKWLLPF